MKCPNCGVSNGKTNKYCRECGTRLEVLASAQDAPENHTDEVALGEQLFKVIELSEAGDLDSAMAQGTKLAEENPSSGSAHSIVGLVFERKAEQSANAGDAEGSRGYLKLAIEHYEKLIDLNPDSAADREKLAALRLKLTGNAIPPTEDGFDFRKAIKTVPIRIWAAGGVFLVVLFLVIFLTPPSQPKPKATAPTAREDTPTVAVTPTQPSDSQLKVYTFNATPNEPTQASPAPAPKMAVPSVTLPQSRIAASEVRPARVPKIDQELTLIAEPKPAPAKKPAAEPAKPADKPAPEKASPPSAPSGGSLLAQAIRLHDQGKISEAIGVANQAVVLYQSDIDAGRNAGAASIGIKNAHRLISVWQESGM